MHPLLRLSCCHKTSVSSAPTQQIAPDAIEHRPGGPYGDLCLLPPPCRVRRPRAQRLFRAYNPGPWQPIRRRSTRARRQRLRRARVRSPVRQPLLPPRPGDEFPLPLADPGWNRDRGFHRDHGHQADLRRHDPRGRGRRPSRRLHHRAHFRLVRPG